MPATDDDVTITRDAHLDISPDEMWQLASSPDGLASWFADSVQIDLRPGGTGTIVDGDVRRDVRVDRVDEGHGYSFTWWHTDEPDLTSTVVIEIGPGVDGGSTIGITETMPAARTSMHASMQARHDRATTDAARIAWEVRVLSLWACTVAVALVR